MFGLKGFSSRPAWLGVWCVLVVMALPGWHGVVGADPGKPPLDPPQFVSTPTQYVVEGETVVDVVEVWARGWRVEDVTFKLTGPKGMRLTRMGRRGCCAWRALLSWRPNQTHVSPTGHRVTLEAKAPGGNAITQSYFLYVINRNDPPQISSSPTLQATQGQPWQYQLKATDPDPTSDALSYRLLRGPKGMVLAQNGLLTWTPTSQQPGSHSVAVEVLDGRGGRTRQSFVVQVAIIQQAPVFRSVPLNHAVVGEPYLYEFVAIDPNPGDVLRYKLASAPTDMKMTEGRALQWIPTKAGTFGVNIEAEDVSGQKVSQVFSIKVLAKSSQAPKVTTLPPQQAVRGKAWRYDVKTSDADGGVTSFALVHAPEGMRLTAKGNEATLEWTPSTSMAPRQTIPVRLRIDDGVGGVTRHDFSVTLDAAPPVLRVISIPPSFAIEGSLWRYQVEATPGIKGLLFSLNRGPSGMQIDPTTGMMRWQPSLALSKPTQNAKISVEVVVEASGGRRQSHAFSLDVYDRNAPPVITSTPPSAATAGLRMTYQVAAKDPDDGPTVLGFRWLRHPPSMQIDAKTGLISWTPSTEDVGRHDVIVEVFDGKGGRSEQRFAIEVKPEAASLRVSSIPIESALVGAMYFYQIRVVGYAVVSSTSRLQFSLLQGPQGLKVDALTGRVTWTPQKEDAGNDPKTVKILVSDRVNTITHSFSIRVFATNTPPQINSDVNLKVKEGEQLSHKIVASDPDGDKLSFFLEEAPANLQVDAVTGALQWRPASWQVGTFGVLVRVDDKRGGVVYLRLSIEVENRNGAPSIVSQPGVRASVGRPYTYAPRAVDADGGTLLQWSLIKWPTGMKLDAGGRVVWTPTDQQVGIHDVILQASDGQPGGTVTQQYQLWVGSVNRPPTFQRKTPPAQGKQGENYIYHFQATDPDPGDVVTFVLREGPTGATIDAYTGLLLWRPNASQVGAHNVTVQVRDASGLAVDTSFSIQVSENSTAPHFISLPVKVAAVGQNYIYDLRAYDPDGDPLYFVRLATPGFLSLSKMRIDSVNRQLLWTPEASHAGKTFLVSLLVKDDNDKKGYQHFLLRVVSGNNRAPTWKTVPPKGTVKTSQGQSYTVRLDAADADGDALSYRLAYGPVGMALTPTGTLSWTPSSSQSGAFVVRVVVLDGKGGMLRHEWQVDVVNRNEPPQIASVPNARLRVGQTFDYKIELTDPDIGIDPQEQLTLLLALAPNGMTLDPMTKTLSWIPTKADVGRHVVQVRARDRLGLAATQLFQVIVEASGTPPEITSQAPKQATEGQPLLYQVTARAYGSRQLTYHLLEAPDGMDIDANAGLLTWRPTNRDARLKRASVSIQVTDEAGLVATQSFSLMVNNLNQAPRFVSPPCRNALTGAYNCVLLVEDEDPLPWQLTVTKVAGPAGLDVQVAKGTTGQRVSLLLKWAPEPSDVGQHLVVLDVSDGAATATLSFHIAVRSNDDAPIADPGPERDFAIEPGELTLDGSQSRDARGNKTGLSYEWSLLQGPTKVEIPTPNTPKVRLILRASGAYIFQLVVSKGDKQSVPAQVRVSVRNLSPTAVIHAPIAANVERVVTLDASDSDDANADALRFRWNQTEGPSVTLDVQDPKRPTFTPAKAGLYQFTLTVEEDRVGGLRSQPTLVDIAVHAPADGENGVYIPHAVIRAPAIGIVGTTMVLDGSRSRGIASERLKTGLLYEWRIIDGPTTGGLSTPKQAQAQLIPPRPGFYQIGLTVKNNLHRSIEAKQWIFVRDAGDAPLPIAVPARRYALLEQWSQLDGSRSRDPAGQQLSFNWSQRLASGGLPVTLRDARSAKPSFFALSRSPYFFQLQVGANGPDSIPVPFMVLVNTVGNLPPKADAGDDKTGDKAVNAGQVTTLDGSKSSDPDPGKEPLRYRWRQIRGFPIALHDAHKANPSFVPVTYGILSFSLRVFDGKAWSWADTVDVVVHDDTNHVPLADPGPDQKVLLRQSVTLDGSGSRDLDPDDELTFRWRLLEPQGTQITFDQVDPKRPRFTAKDPNIAKYVFGLIVDDGKSSSLEQRVTVTVLNANQPPQARIEGVEQAFVDEEIELDGSKSTDADGDKLSFTWEQTFGPKLALNETQGNRLKVRFAKEGTYTFQLKVFDGFASSEPKSITIQVRKRETGVSDCSCSSSRDAPTSGAWMLLLFFFLLYLKRQPRTTR